MQLIQGIVKFPAGKPMQGQYGNRQNVVVSVPGKDDNLKVWFNEGDTYPCSLKKGDSVRVLEDEKNGRTTYKLIEPQGFQPQTQTQPQTQQSQPYPQPQPQPATMSRDDKIQLVKSAAKLYAFCLQETLENLAAVQVESDICEGGFPLSEESILKAATTVFISVSPKILGR